MRPLSSPPPAPDTAESTKLRLTFLALLLASLFVLLLARLWFLQVMAGGSYAEAAQSNAVREIPIEAPRGQILDREGRPLVANRYARVVSVQPEEMGARSEEVLTDLADLLGLERSELDRRIEGSRVSALRPKPIAIDVPQDVLYYLHENASTRYPGVYVESRPLRTYPEGDLAAHVVGYAGEISDVELAEPDYAGYRPGDVIGWAGLERTYERVLRGVEGVRRLEVDRQNRVVGQLPEELPQPGEDLVTTIDIEAQELAEDALAEGIAVARTQMHSDSGRLLDAPAGSVVVLDPRNGEVRAMASFPTFDPEEFVGGVGSDYWDSLQDEDNHFPLINRAISSSYPPGSVFKTVSAGTALRTGQMDYTSTLPCPGVWRFGQQQFRNHTATSQGPYNLAQALVHSCDTVFYELARGQWQAEEAQLSAGEIPTEVAAEQARLWGFGQLQGIDLPAERAGVVPGRTWKREFWEGARETYCAKAETLEQGTYGQLVNADLCVNGNRWRGGDAVNMSIGQGDVQATPLQVASSYAAIANGGTLWRPHVGREVVAVDGTVEAIAPEAFGTLPMTPTDLAFIESGLIGVTSPGGTAARPFAGFPFTIAGKTGTAELKPKQPYAWFAGYNVDPVAGEEYVVVAMIEQGGGGSATAAPIVRRIFEGLLQAEQTEIAVDANATTG